MNKLTPRERLLRAIAGEPVDRIPIAPRIWRYSLSKGTTDLDLANELDFELLELGGGGLTTPFDDERCDAVSGLIPDVNIEVVSRRDGAKTYYTRRFATPGGTLTDAIVRPDPGGAYGIQPSIERIEPPVKSASDVELLRYLLPDPRLIRANFPAVQEREKTIGDRGLIGYRPSRGVDHIVVDSLGIENALISSIDDPELMAKTIDVVDEWHMALIREILEAGWRIVFDPWYNFSLSFGWSPSFYVETVKPVIARHAELVHSYNALMFFYDDGKMANSIEHVVDAGADIIQTVTPPPAGDLDYSWVADTVGGKVCLNGGMDTVAMRFESADFVKARTIETIDILAPTGRFILGSSDSFTEGTPEENIHAFFEMGKLHGAKVAKRLYD